MIRQPRGVTALGWPLASAHTQAPGPGHFAWTTSLKKRVVPANDTRASQVRCVGMAGDRGALKAYLDSLAAVTRQTIEAMGKPQHGAVVGGRLDRRPDKRMRRPMGDDWQLHDAR